MSESIWSWLWEMLTGDFAEPAGNETPPSKADPIVVSPAEIEIGDAGSSGGFWEALIGGGGSRTVAGDSRSKTRSASDMSSAQFSSPATVNVKLGRPVYEIDFDEKHWKGTKLADLFGPGDRLTEDEGQDFLSGFGGVTGQKIHVGLVEPDPTISTAGPLPLRAETSGPISFGGDSWSLPGAKAAIGYHKRIPATVIGQPTAPQGTDTGSGGGGGGGGDETESPAPGTALAGYGDRIGFLTNYRGPARAEVETGFTRKASRTLPTGAWKMTADGPVMKYGGNVGRMIDDGDWDGRGTVIRVEVTPQSTLTARFDIEAGDKLSVTVTQVIRIHVLKRKYLDWKFGGPILAAAAKVYSWVGGKAAGTILAPFWKWWSEKIYSA